MGPNPNVQISNITFLDKILKNLGFISIWADSSYGSTHIFPANYKFRNQFMGSVVG
jgi:hypothetical protein